MVDEWASAERGTFEDALDALLPHRNIPYKAQLAARSKELDQTLDDIVQRCCDAPFDDKRFTNKPPIVKPPLEDLIPMMPNVGFERNVTLGLEKDAKGKIHVGIRVLYEKEGGNKQFLLPILECSNVTPQIVKAAEAAAVFLTQQNFNVYDGVKNCKDIYGLKFTMNEIGEIIMSLVLVIDDISDKDILKTEDVKVALDESEGALKIVSNTVNWDKVEDVLFFMPGGFEKQLREFFFKSNVKSQIRGHLEKYAPALKKFVEDNRTRLGVVGAYITWYDANSPPGKRPAARPWYHVAGNQCVTETINSIKIELFPQLENFHPSRAHAIPTIVNTIIDGLGLRCESSRALVVSEFYFLQCLIARKCKHMGVLGAMQESLQSYLKEKHRKDVYFVSFPRDSSMKIFSSPETPDKAIHWGQFKEYKELKRFYKFTHLRKEIRPQRIAWVIDTREDSIESRPNKLNVDLLERNHMMLYPDYTLSRVVGIDVGPQKNEQLTLVAFYERVDQNIKLKSGKARSGGAKESGPSAEKVHNDKDQGVPTGKRKAPDQQGHSGSKLPRRGGSQQPLKRSSVRSNTRAPMRPRGSPLNPWGGNRSMARPATASSQAGSAVMSQLTDVIGKQLLLAQMSGAHFLPSSSSIMEMGLDSGAAGSPGGYDRSSLENDDFPPPPHPRQFPTAVPNSRAGGSSPRGAREGYRSAVQGEPAHDDFRSDQREYFARDDFRSDARQNFTRDDFWSTPLQDIACNKFRSASPSREDFQSASPSREAVRRLSDTREDFTQDNYRSALRNDLACDDFRSARQKNSDGATDNDFQSGGFRGIVKDQSRSAMKVTQVPQMFPSSKGSAHDASSIRRATRDDFNSNELRSAKWRDSTSAPQDHSTTSRNFGNATQVVSRNDGKEGLTSGNFWGTVRAVSPHDDARKTAQEYFRTPDHWTTKYEDSRSASWENSRSVAKNDFVRDGFRNATMEGVALDKMKSTSREGTHADIRMTAHDDFTGGGLRSASSKDPGSAVQDDFSRVAFRNTDDARSRDGWENARSTAEDNFMSGGFRNATRKDIALDTFSSTSKKGSNHPGTSMTAQDDFTGTELRSASWKESASAAQDDFTRVNFRNADDSRRAARDYFRSTGREDSSYNNRRNSPNKQQDQFTRHSSVSRDKFISLVDVPEPRDEFRSTTQRDTHYSSGSSPRYGYDSVGRNSMGDGNTNFEGSNRYRSSSGFSGHPDAWGGDSLFRRN